MVSATHSRLLGTAVLTSSCRRTPIHLCSLIVRRQSENPQDIATTARMAPFSPLASPCRPTFHTLSPTPKRPTKIPPMWTPPTPKLHEKAHGTQIRQPRAPGGAIRPARLPLPLQRFPRNQNNP